MKKTNITSAAAQRTLLRTDTIRSIAGIVESETLIAFRAYGRADVDAGFALGISRE